jgi:hypothetical protein
MKQIQECVVTHINGSILAFKNMDIVSRHHEHNFSEVPLLLVHI